MASNGTPGTPSKPKRPPGRKYTKDAFKRCMNYLIGNPTASNQEVAKALDVHPNSVTAARKTLVDSGVLKPSFYDRTPRAANAGGRPPIDTGAELAEALSRIQGTDGEPLTSEEMERRLSSIVRRAAVESNDQLTIAAITALRALKAALGDKTRLGPGPPLTYEQKVERTGLILDVVGTKIAVDALFRVFNPEALAAIHTEIGLRLTSSTHPPAETEAVEQPEPLSSPSTPSTEAETPLPHVEIA